jgi:tRNA pseudouridine38-40 synthase
VTSAGRLTRSLAATVAYDGTDFLGFQWQARGRTVQGVLETALDRVSEAHSRVIGAGRTDAGVHAQGQVIGFQIAWRHPLAELHWALNAVLPDDLVVCRLEEAEPGWHPRFSATSRHYRYTVLNQATRSPLDRRYAHHVAQPLNLAALNAGAAVLVGEHDFASFGQAMVRVLKAAESGAKGEAACAGSTLRSVLSAEWRQHGEWSTFDIVGNAFLRGMVRSIVGTLLQVGIGLWTSERVAEILAGRSRAMAAPPAPACGLCLMRVFYDNAQGSSL